MLVPTQLKFFWKFVRTSQAGFYPKFGDGCQKKQKSGGWSEFHPPLSTAGTE
jgi:hypothetical protein